MTRIEKSLERLPAGGTVGDVMTLASGGPEWAAPGEPGGGSTPGSARVLGPFPFAFNTAGLTDGVTVWTPAVGDILVDAWLEVDTAWDGTTPLGNLGQPVISVAGWLGTGGNGNDLTVADSEIGDVGGLLTNTTQPALALIGAPGVSGIRNAPARFGSVSPVKVWVTQEGSAGGTSPGAAQGSGAVYLIVATPSLT